MAINALISTYGLFWKRENVHWGRPKNAGHLLGFAAKAKRTNIVDFREQQGIYALYDGAYQLIYVGQAGSGANKRLFRRLKDHTRDHLADRWTKFSWFGIQRALNNGELSAEKQAAHTTISAILDQMEAILIVAAEPRHNKQGGRFGKLAKQFLQFRDVEALGLEPNVMLSNIAKSVESIASEQRK
ncbi:MAG: GIY-YIG nuclease family protein [Pseudomonadota bacterium]